jgi:hypothetical protein
MQHPNPSDHARHDPTLIAGHAAGDLADTERARADALLAECEDCSELRRDLVALAAATRSVPAPATLARDLRLAPEQAARLRRGSWLRRLLQPFGAPGSPFRPMATAFTSLGIVGLVVGITLSSGAGLAGGAASGPAFEPNNAPAPMATRAAVGRDAAAEAATGVPVAQVADQSDDMSVYYATKMPHLTVLDAAKSRAPKTEEPAGTRVALGALDRASQNQSGNERAIALLPTPPNPLIAGSLALLGIGLLLFGLRIASRRVR